MLKQTESAQQINQGYKRQLDLFEELENFGNLSNDGKTYIIEQDNQTEAAISKLLKMASEQDRKSNPSTFSQDRGDFNEAMLEGKDYLK